MFDAYKIRRFKVKINLSNKKEIKKKQQNSKNRIRMNKIRQTKHTQQFFFLEK